MKNHSCLIVLNYNGIKYLKSNVLQIFNLCKSYKIDFFIGDDNSTDGSINFMNKNSMNYFINSNKNSGYAANLNNVLKNILDSGYREFIVANSDIELTNDFFKNYGKTLESLNGNKKWGLLGFTEVNKLFKKQIFTDSNNIKLLEVKNIKGFLYVINKKLIDKIGYFDESYFMYGEDNDYFFRTIRAGFEIYESPIKVFHYSEGSNSNLTKNSWLAYRNSILFARKNLSVFGIIKLFISIIHIIYNPYYKRKDPSVIRLRRSGFFKNHKFLFKSIIWNIKYKL